MGPAEVRRPLVRLAFAVLAAGLAFALGACGVGGDDGEDGGEPTTERQESVAGEVAGEGERPLEDGWYEDPDGDVVPTAVEEAIGSDPTADDCIADLECPGISGELDLTELEETDNTLLILDSSGSMKGPAGGGGGERKIDAAKDALERYALGTPDRYELGFMVYGGREQRSGGSGAAGCDRVELVEPLGGVNHANFDQALAEVDPHGATPLASSLETATNAFQGREGEPNRVIMVTDGKESCDGDPVAAAGELRDAGIEVTVDVVGFDIDESADADALRAIAEAGGGEYTDARTGDELRDFIAAESQLVREENEALACLVSNQNTYSACQVRQENDAVAYMVSEENTISAESVEEENTLSAESVREENDASAAGDDERADELQAERERITSELAAEREALTSAIAEIRERVSSELTATRERDDAVFDRLRDQIEREAEEVRRRIEQRYGDQTGSLGATLFVCRPPSLRTLSASLDFST